MKTKLLLTAVLILVVNLLSAGTPRTYLQKCILNNGEVPPVYNTGATTSPDYIVHAIILETGEALGTDLGTTAQIIRLSQGGNGTTTPYFAMTAVNLGAFATQWQAGQTLQMFVKHIASQEETTWTLVIPSGGGTINIQDTAQIIPPYISTADFNADIVFGNAPLHVQFTDTSFITDPDSIISWLWDFGDGQISSEQHPIHIYQQEGLYDVCLGILTQNDSLYSIQKTDHINVLPQYFVHQNDFSQSAGPEWSNPSIDTAPNGGEKFLGRFINHTVSFNRSNLPPHNRISIEFDLYIIDSWDADEIWSMSVNGETIINTSFSNIYYNQAYPDNLPASNPPRSGVTAITEFGFSTVWGDDAIYHISRSLYHNSDSLNIVFSASNMEPLDNESWGIDNILITYLDQPEVNFNVNQHSGQMPLTVDFTDASLPGVSAITSWAWDFDNDGSIDSNTQNPSWTYYKSGNYSVSLTVSDGTYSVTTTKERYIHVENNSLVNGLVAYYPFTNGAEDFSGNNRDGTAFGATLTIDRFGRENYAYYFNGLQDRINIPDTFIFNTPGDAAMSIWLNRSDFEHRYLLMSRNDGQDTNRFCATSYYHHNGIRLIYKGEDGVDRLFIPDIDRPNWSTDTWTHFVINRIGNTYFHYMNGTLIYSITDDDPHLPTYTGPWTLGLFNTGANNGFKGSIDDLRIYNRALQTSEISFLYASDTQTDAPIARFSVSETSGAVPFGVSFQDESAKGLNEISSWAWDLDSDGIMDSSDQHPSYVYPNPGTYSVSLTVSDGTLSDTLTKTGLIVVQSSQGYDIPGLVAYYPFNGNANDESGYNNHGSLNGPLPAEDRNGNANCAFAFDGDDYIVVPNAPSLNSQQLSLCAWVSFESSGSENPRIFSKRANNSLSGYELRAFTENNLRKLKFGSANQNEWRELDSSQRISTDRWQFITATYDGQKQRLYLNGQLIAQQNFAGNLASSSSDLFIGKLSYGWDGLFKGKMDELRIYNRAISDPEVQMLYLGISSALSVVQPSFGSNYLVQSQKTISWAASDSLGNVSIEYSTDNGRNWMQIVNSYPSAISEYSWIVPNTPSDSCRVRITSRNHPEIFAESSNFRIYRYSTSFAQNLIAYYPFDGDLTDLSMNNLNPQNNGATFTADRFGNPDSAAYFNGSSYIRTYQDIPETDYTLAFWFQTSETSTGLFSVCDGNGSANDRNIHISYNNIYHRLHDTQTISANIPNLSDNNWHFLSMVVEAGVGQKMYIDGQQVAFGDKSASDFNWQTFYDIGWSRDGTPFFTGSIDDFRLFNQPLSAQDIAAMYSFTGSSLIYLTEPHANQTIMANSECQILWYAESSISTVNLDFSPDNGVSWQSIATGIPAQTSGFMWQVPNASYARCKLRISDNADSYSLSGVFSIAQSSLEIGLEAHYLMDGNGTDASGKGKHGTLTSMDPAPNRFGMDNRALSLDAKSDYFITPEFNSPNISVSGWYYYDGNLNGGWNCLVNGRDIYNLMIHPVNGEVQFLDYNGEHASGYFLQQGKWYHIALVKEGFRHRLYVNANLVMDTSDGFSNTQFPVSRLGNSIHHSHGSIGIMDDYRIYDRALALSEIRALYDKPGNRSITGRIVSSENPDNGLAGATVILGNNYYITTTDADGYYSLYGMPINQSYSITADKEGFASYKTMLNLWNADLNLGTFVLGENTNLPYEVLAMQESSAAFATITWRNNSQIDEGGFSSASQLSREFLGFSIYRLLTGDEDDTALWTYLSNQNETSYQDFSWAAAPFGVYKYAIRSNYTNAQQSAPVFSNEISRRSFGYYENFNQGGVVPAGWTTMHNGSTTSPWSIVLDSGSDYSFRVSNSSQSSANEFLYSPVYDFSRYDRISVYFWHNYVPNANSQARFQYSTNGVTWTTAASWTSAANYGIKIYDVSTETHHQSQVRFRWLFTASSFATNSWSIDDFSVTGNANIQLNITDLHPTESNRRQNTRAVLIGARFVDDELVNASSLFYRIDANGNGSYDPEEEWIPISGYSNAPQISVRVTANFATEGMNLRYEFKAADVAGNPVSYSGFNRLNGIDDDYSIDIDTIPPPVVSGLALVSGANPLAVLNWNPVADQNFDSYQIFFGSNPQVGINDSHWSKLDDPALANAETASTSVTALLPNTNYWFRIRAIDQFGNFSELSEPVLYVKPSQALVISNPQPENQPLPVWQSQRSIMIGCTFADYYGVDASTIEYRIDNNGNGLYDVDELWLPLSNVRSAQNSKVSISRTSLSPLKSFLEMSEAELSEYCSSREQLTVLVPVAYTADGADLRFEFRASDIHGFGPVYSGLYLQVGYSDDWRVKIDSIAPDSTTQVGTGLVTANSVEITWQPVLEPNFTTYEVYYSTQPGVSLDDELWDFRKDPLLAYPGTDVMVTNITGLNLDTRYYFRVRAVDEAGHISPLSEEISAIFVASVPPRAPQNLQISIEGNDIVLSWDAVSENLDGESLENVAYNIYLSDRADFVVDVGYLFDNTSVSSYTIYGAAALADRVFVRVCTTLGRQRMIRRPLKSFIGRGKP